MIYIDGSHDYNSVKNDVLVWYPKLKQNGMMFGHDFPNPWNKDAGFEELGKAVHDYVWIDQEKFRHFGFLHGIWAAIKN